MVQCNTMHGRGTCGTRQPGHCTVVVPVVPYSLAIAQSWYLWYQTAWPLHRRGTCGTRQPGHSNASCKQELGQEQV